MARVRQFLVKIHNPNAACQITCSACLERSSPTGLLMAKSMTQDAKKIMLVGISLFKYR
jgi:hypothetical protein